MADQGSPRIAYILDEFPSLSETFILRELIALQRRGLQIDIFAMKPQATGPVHEEAMDLAARTNYRPPVVSAKLWGRQLLWLTRRPWLQLEAFAWAAGHLREGVRAWAVTTRMVLTAADLASELCRRGIRHVHAQFAGRPATVALLASRLAGTTFSFAAHARDVFTPEARLLREKLEAARFVVACTNAGKEALLARAGAGFADKVKVVHHGLDLSQWNVPRRPVVPPLILSIGRLVPKKGFDTLLRACRLLADTGVSFQCEIIGEGPLHAALSSQVAELALSDRITLRGAVSQDQVRDALSMATVFALASRVTTEGDRDGLPNVLLEAMAARVPVVATEVGGIPEAVDDNRTGLLVPPDDPEALSASLRELLLRPELRERLAETGRRRVEAEFDVNANVAPLFAMFQEAIRR